MFERLKQSGPREEQPAQAPATGRHIATLIVGAVVPAVLTLLVATVVFAQGQGNDKYSLKSPGGIAFSDFKGYEDDQKYSLNQYLRLIDSFPVFLA